jgi:hypothetical protein
MKILKIIIITFIIAFLTSLMFEWDFVDKNVIRKILVVIMIVMELVAGFFYIKTEIKPEIK